MPPLSAGYETHAALLAPVPEEHLVAGSAVADMYGKVAFGSRAWEVFRNLDVLRGDHPVTAYLYASHPVEHRGPKVTWEGLYVGHVESRGGAYPGSKRLRPPTTAEYQEDRAGYWAVYWHVSSLQPLDADEWVDIADLRNFKTQRRYGQGFVPEGPIVVGHP